MIASIAFLLLLGSANAQLTIGDLVDGFRQFAADQRIETTADLVEAIKLKGNLVIAANANLTTQNQIVLAPASRVKLENGAKLKTEGCQVDSGVSTIEGGLIDFGTKALGLIKAGATLAIEGTAQIRGTVNVDGLVKWLGVQTCDATTKIVGGGKLSLEGTVKSSGSADVVLGERDKSQISLTKDCVLDTAAALVKFAAAATIEASTDANAPGCQCKGEKGIVFDNGCSMVDKSKITVSQESKCVVANGPMVVKEKCSSVVTGAGKLQVQASAKIDVQAGATLTIDSPCEVDTASSVNIAAGASAIIKAVTTFVGSAEAKAYFNLLANASLTFAAPVQCDKKCGVKGNEESSVVVFAPTPAPVSQQTVTCVKDTEIVCKSVTVQDTKVDFNATVSVQASLEVKGTSVVAVNPGTLTCKKEVKCTGGQLNVKSQSTVKVEAAIHVEASAKFEIEQGASVVTKQCNCGYQAAMPSSKAQFVIGGNLTVQGGFNIDGAKCDLAAENSEIIVGEGSMAMTDAEVQSEVRGGDYKCKQISCRGKCRMRNTGNAKFTGSIRVQADAHFEAAADLAAAAKLMLEDRAKLTSAGKTVSCNDAEFGDNTVFVASFPKVAAESVASLAVAAKASFKGTIEIATYGALKKGDKFTVAKYKTRDGSKFSKVMLAGNAAGGAGRKRSIEETNEWVESYDDAKGEYTVTYNGEDREAQATPAPPSAVPTGTPDSASSLALSLAAVAAVAALAL